MVDALRRTAFVLKALITSFIVTACGLLSTAPAAAQIVNPADKQGETADNAPEPPSDHHTWTMPPIEVFGKAPLNEEDLIGEYGQPRWTAHRRFSETRVYVIPKGMVEFEYWLNPETPKVGPTAFTSMYELELGLPKRFQLDLYADVHKTGSSGSFALDEQKVEVRYAFADWNKIFGNPTVYLEWSQESQGPDLVEGKILLGGQLVSRWHWGVNFVSEQETGGAREISNEWTTGLSYSLRDTKLSVGIETQLAMVNSKIAPGLRSPYETHFLVGPSLQFRPLPQMHIDFTPLFGTTTTSLRARTFVVMGYEF
jgi:hypothetical protein